MQIRLLIECFLIVLVIPLGATAEFSEPPRATLESVAPAQPSASAINFRLATAEAAIAAVHDVMGISPVARSHVVAQLETCAQDETPFLKDHVRGKTLWHVVLREVRMPLPSLPPGIGNSPERTFDVLMDAGSGKLISIVSRWPESEPPIAAEPSAEKAELRMARANQERYHDFAESQPETDFVEALEIILRDGLGNPLIAKQILARHVIQSTSAREPRAVWAITLRGIPPIRERPGLPPDALNHVRNVIDSSTGEWLEAGTSPQPDWDREKTQVQESGQASE